MEIFTEKNKPCNDLPAFYTEEEAKTSKDIVGRIIAFIKFSKQDRLRAGICLGSEGRREWIEQSALVIPSRDLLE